MRKRWMAAAVVVGLGGATAGALTHHSARAATGIVPVEQRTEVSAPWQALDTSDTPEAPKIDMGEVAGEAGLDGQTSYF